MVGPQTTRALLGAIFVVAGAGIAQGQSATADCPLHNRKTGNEPLATSPYAGLETRPIKALSSEQHQQLLAGQGMGLALAAELNHYPGPKHVLELASAIDLTQAQVRETRTIFHEMQTRAQALGREIIDAEAELDGRFAAADIDEALLAEGLENIGRLRAELRLAHLRAHLRMKASLSTDQVSRYDDLRGYGASTGSD